MQTYFTDEEESANPIFTVAVADYEDIFNVSRNQASRDVKEGVFELSRSAIIFYPKTGRHDVIARPWLTEAGGRSSKGLWEIEFNHKVLPYLYVLGSQFTTYSLRDCGSLKTRVLCDFMRAFASSEALRFGSLRMIGFLKDSCCPSLRNLISQNSNVHFRTCSKTDQ